MVLGEKAFEKVVSSVGAALEQQGYARQEAPGAEGGQAALFIGPEMAYGVFYEEKQKRFILRYCDVEDGRPDEKWRNRSVLLFDPEDEQEAHRLTDSIIADFSEEVSARANTSAALAKVKKNRKQKKSDTTDAVFFYNRLVNVFPELREAIILERIHYGEIRQVSFAKREVLPRMAALLAENRDEGAVKKLAAILGELYLNGNFDVRSIITMTLLNGLSDSAYAALLPLFEKDLSDGAKAARRLRGKRVKPEKPPKKKRIVAENLDGKRR